MGKNETLQERARERAALFPDSDIGRLLRALANRIDELEGEVKAMEYAAEHARLHELLD